jgi:HEAT repeat protein
MAASHLEALQDLSVVPLLVKALDDDHAYVRSCAALRLGRLRATETRERLKVVMEQDWDQTVRSRAREALERMRE